MNENAKQPEKQRALHTAIENLEEKTFLLIALSQRVTLLADSYDRINNSIKDETPRTAFDIEGNYTDIIFELCNRISTATSIIDGQISRLATLLQCQPYSNPK